MLENGMYLVDRYEIISKVGAGGMSDVYKAKDHILGRTVAIKVMKAEFSEDVNFVTKFRSEAQSAAGLEHPNIVNIYDVGSENGLHFIVMEYVEGITLKTYVEKKGQLSFKEATSIAIQVARGIEVAHNKEIIHRDIKPQNIIISTEGKVKVTDFGIARAISSNTISAEVMGSVHYASPEQARNGFVDGRSDIYSLGIVMYEMVTGRVPFDGDTTVSVAIQHLQEEMVEPSAYAPELPVSYEKIVLKATQKNPDRRYQTIMDLIADLRKALANPEEDFVVIAPIGTIAKTRVIGGEELEAIQNSAENANLDKENVYATTQDEDEYDEYTEFDEEEDTTGFLNPKWDKAVNIALVAIAILIVGVIIWLAISVVGLFEKKPSTNTQPPVNQGITGTTEPGSTVPDTTVPPETEEETVTMINIVGQQQDVAKENLEILGLEMFVIITESDKPIGEVLEQSERAGNEVKKGSTITVVVSGEVDSAVLKDVPNVVEMPAEEAEDMLRNAGFMVYREYAYNDTVPLGSVISQDPSGGSNKKPGTSVTIVISDGKAPVTLPNDMIGEKKDAVEYVLTGDEYGFAVEFVEEYNADITAGYVFKLEGPNGELAGTAIPYGSNVKVYVSLGADPNAGDTENPDNTEDTENPGNSEDAENPGNSEDSENPGNSENPDDPVGGETTTYKYNGSVSTDKFPAGATHYTYILYDKDGNILKEVDTPTELNGSISILVSGLNTSTGKLVVHFWQAPTEGESTQPVKMEGSSLVEDNIAFTEEA